MSLQSSHYQRRQILMSIWADCYCVYYVLYFRVSEKLKPRLTVHKVAAKNFPAMIPTRGFQCGDVFPVSACFLLKFSDHNPKGFKMIMLSQYVNLDCDITE